MFTRLLTAAALAALVVCGTAQAAPVTVQLRVEGATSTIFEGPLTTDAKTIDKGDGPHLCDGTNGGLNPAPGPTMTSALDDGSLLGGFSWEASWNDGFQDFFLSAIGPDRNDFAAGRSWGYAHNYQEVTIGGCQRQVGPGDGVLFAYDFFGGPPDYRAKTLLSLNGPSLAQVGQSITIVVSDGATGSPVGGAAVGGKVTRLDGRARLSFETPGLKQLKAERADSIRSNALSVCVVSDQGGACGVPLKHLGRGGSGAGDRRAPVARITSPRSGARYRRGPRVLRGTAGDDGSGLREVKLSLRRRLSGSCSWWNGRLERFTRRSCRRSSFFDVGSDRRWSYLLPRRLSRGRYVLDVQASDQAGNREERFIRGKTRVVFEVLGRRNRSR